RGRLAVEGTGTDVALGRPSNSLQRLISMTLSFLVTLVALSGAAVSGSREKPRSELLATLRDAEWLRRGGHPATALQKLKTGLVACRRTSDDLCTALLLTGLGEYHA